MTESARKQWRIILVGWAVYASYMAVSAYIVSARLGKPITWWEALTGDLSYAAVWVVMTPLVLWLARLWRFEKGRLVRTAILHLTASIVLALIHKGIHGILFGFYRSAVEGEAISWELQYRHILAYFDYGVQVYWLIIILSYAYDYYTRYRENEIRTSQLEAELAQAQLQALKRQLQPHFLFNTLHTISGLVRNNEKRRAVDMIAGLSDLLRTSLDTADQHEVPLRRELEILERYLEIEQVRFSDRIATRVQVGEGAADAAVPNLILQPIVENAIRHGLAGKEEGGTITIRAARKDGTLEINIEDDGVGLAQMTSEVRMERVGLANARERLRHLYGERGSLSVSSLEGGGTRVSLSIPWRVCTENDHEVP